MVSQSMPSSARMSSPCSLNSGARLAGAGSPPNWIGARHDLEGRAARGLGSPACSRWPRTAGRPCRFERVLHDAPLAGEVGQPLAPLGQRVLGEAASRSACASARVLQERVVVGEAGVGRQLGPPDQLAQLGPVLARPAGSRRTI